jgi:uncharacterized protein
MRQRVDFITLGVPDLAEARRFFIEGLGWQVTWEVPGDIVFIQVGHGLLLSLFGDDALAADIGEARTGSGTNSMTLSHNVSSEAEVDEQMARAAQAGATVIKPPQRAEFGGYHGYFADPAGFRWEICYNSGWSVAPDGKVTLGPVGG